MQARRTYSSSDNDLHIVTNHRWKQEITFISVLSNCLSERWQIFETRSRNFNFVQRWTRSIRPPRPYGKCLGRRLSADLNHRYRPCNAHQQCVCEGVTIVCTTFSCLFTDRATATACSAESRVTPGNSVCSSGHRAKKHAKRLLKKTTRSFSSRILKYSGDNFCRNSS